MVSSRSLAALALASLLVLAGCMGGPATDTQANPTPNDAPADQSTNVTVNLERGSDDGSTVVVAGQGSVEAEPDAATIRLRVVAEGDKPETVRNRLSKNVTAARQALVDYGLDEEQIRSTRFRIDENYRARREPDAGHPKFIGTHELVVELDDAEAVGDVIDAAVESGPVRVEGVTFGLSEERREQLREEALSEAMADARGEAEIVAGAEGLELAAPKWARTDQVQVHRAEGTVVRAEATPTAVADGGSASTTVESGDVTVTASVRIAYNATELETYDDGEE